jgi:NAD(P)-dependent dehydrogenase (short-subunit alcohol dehydrogenase family)
MGDMDLSLKDKVAIVTGAGGNGIGTAVCMGLAHEGACVVANDVDRSRADSIAKQLRALGIKSIPTCGNVTSISDCRDMVDKTLAEFGRVDILVTIPALMIYKDFARCTPEELRQQTDVTFWGTVNGVKAVVDAMIRQRSGSIVCMGSDSAKMGPAMETMYASSKAAMMTFASSLSKEIGPYGVRINVVNAALVRRPGAGAGMEEAFRGNYPLGRLAEASEVADAILFLASDRASFITGQTLSVNGGRL